MAQKAKKDRAKANAAALNQLHLGSLVTNAVFLLFYLFFRSRSLWLYGILSLPAFICEAVLETTGRPKFDAAGALRTAGEDLSSPGLTEYMFDIIWVTWASQILVVLLGNYAWMLWTAVPVYGAYKGVGLFGAAKQMAGMAGMGAATQADGAQQPAGNRRQRRAA
jgi:hypothetical protein